jgi:hypothetical protein
MKYGRRGAELRLGSKLVGRISSGIARLVTDSRGAPIALVGISEQPQKVAIHLADRAPQNVDIQTNMKIAV